MMKKRAVSACYVRVLQVCAFVLASAYIFVGCEEASVGDNTPPAQSVAIDNVVAGASSISFRVQNPNAEAVRVTIALTPPPPDAARILVGNVSNIATHAAFSLTASGTQDNILISDLTSGEVYTITLTTADSNGNQQSKKAVTHAAPIPPESAPQNPSVTAADRSVSLAWAAPFSGGAVSGYRIYRATGGGGTLTRLTTTPETLPATTRTYTDSSVTNGTAYSYTVRAVTRGGTESAHSAVVNATPLAAPDAPTALSATAGNGEVALSWAAPTAGTPVTQYSVYRVEGTDIDSATRVPAVITETTYTDATAANGTAYSYVVRAANSNGTESGNSNTVSATPFAPAGAPNSLDATAAAGNVSLKWTPPADTSMVSGYRIYRATGSDTLALLLTTPTILPATTFAYTDSAVTNGTEYRYAVRAVNANGTENAASEVARATPLALPSVPADLSANGGNGIVTLSWSTPTDGGPVSQYHIYRALGSDISMATQVPTLTTVTGTTYIDTNVSNDVEYSYSVRSINANGAESADSNTASTTPLVPPGAPTNLRAALGNAFVLLSWDAPAGGTEATQYYIYRVAGTDIGSVTRVRGTSPAMITKTAYTDRGLTNGTEYSYVVRAVNANNTQSASSNTVSITPSESVAEAVATIVANAPQITLTWGAVTGADEYQIYRSVGGGSEARLTTPPPTLTDTTYIDRDIIYGIAYRYRIQAIVGGEMGLSSDTARTGAPVDGDGDRLIDIRNLDMLSNMRYNLSGTSYKTSDSDSGLRCGTDGTVTCTGYELMRDLDFFVASDYANGTLNVDWLPRAGDNFSAPESATNRGWQPVGDNSASFSTRFEGNGKRVRNLYTRNAANIRNARFGLFGQTSGGASLRNFVIENGHAYGGREAEHIGIAVGVNGGIIANVVVRGGSVRGGNASDEIGGLAGSSNGAIIASSSSAAVYGEDGTSEYAGSLVGRMTGGHITASYATGAVDGGMGGTDHVGSLVGFGDGTIRASYATGSVDGGSGASDYAGGLVGAMTSAGAVIANYAIGDVDGGAGTRDYSGQLIGITNVNAVTLTANYGFGTLSGNEQTAFGGQWQQNNGNTLPSGVTTAAQLTAPGSATTTAVAAEWNQMARSTLNAWDFGTNSQPPALRYADYDGAGGTDYCALFSVIPGTETAITCGTTLLPGQDRGSTSSTPFDLTVLSSAANTILVSSTSSHTVPFTAVVRNAYGASSSPTAAMATDAGATTLTYYRSADSVISRDTDTALSPVYNVPAIAGGATHEQSASVSVPGAVGAYYYYACVSASSESNTESNTANNCSLVTTVTVITSIDSDNDTLIDINNLDMLSHIRHNLDGTSYVPVAGGSGIQCGANNTTPCTGYELLRDLDFAVAADYANGTVNMEWRPTAGGSVVAPGNATNRGWQPLGTGDFVLFTAIFEGNGRSISNLYSRNTANANAARTALFGQLKSGSTLRNLLIKDSNVYGGSREDFVGVAVGLNNGTITNVVVRGGSAHGGNEEDEVGGLAGRNGGTIVASSASSTAVYGGGGNSDDVGGLVGLSAFSTITASYATGAVNDESGNGDRLGGLVGGFGRGTIRASYARGNVNDEAGSNDRTGGLVGRQTDGSIVASYALGNANDGGTGTGDSVGALIGARTNGTDTASYGFGSVSGAGSVGPAGSTLPAGATTASQLTIPVAMNPPMTATPAEWNQMTSSTLNAWVFGTNTETPALRYADYDGAGGTDYCALFTNIPGTNTAITCGTTLLPSQERGDIARAAFDFTVASVRASQNTFLINQSADIHAVVRNLPFLSSSPANATLTFYRSTDDSVDTSNDTEVGSAAMIPALAGGATSMQTTSTDAPATAGVYYYYACVEAASESNTENNCSSPAAVRVIPPIDSDDDKLIDIRSLDMLNDVRYNTLGTSYKTGIDSATDTATFRCGTSAVPVDCAGYELLRDLDFAVATDYESGSVNMEWRPTAEGSVVDSEDATNGGWSPIIGASTSFGTLFEGNGYTVRNLYSRNIEHTIYKSTGLFGQLTTSGTLRNLLIENGNMYGGSMPEYVGVAAGQNFGSIVNVAVRGGSVHGGGGADEVGGIAGRNQGRSIIASSSNVAAYGDDGIDKVGGLVGLNINRTSLIIASYATGAVYGGAGQDEVGGLVGSSNGAIYASYARGDADADAGNGQEVGGLVGEVYAFGTVTTSYAIGHANSGTGSSNSVATLVGALRRANGAITESSYSFGVASGNDTPYSTDMNGPDDGIEKPSGVTTAEQLTAPGSAAATAVPAGWNRADRRSANAWDFGAATQTPALRYADYDGAGGTDYCALFSSVVPGTSTPITCGTTLLPWQERTQVTRSAFDFTVSLSTDTAVVSPGVPFTLTANVQNMPFAGPAPTTTLTYYRSAGNVVNRNIDTAVGTAPVPTLRGGVTSTQDITRTLPVEGRYYYYACVGAGTGEADATNNCSAVMQIMVMNAHDLAVVRSHLTATRLRIRNSTPVTFSATVRNLGAVATSAPAVLSYYRSTNNIVDTSRDTNIGSDTIPILAADATSAQNIMITAPATAGNYYYYVCVTELPGENVANNCSTPALMQVLPTLHN